MLHIVGARVDNVNLFPVVILTNILQNTVSPRPEEGAGGSKGTELLHE